MVISLSWVDLFEIIQSLLRFPSTRQPDQIVSSDIFLGFKQLQLFFLSLIYLQVFSATGFQFSVFQEICRWAFANRITRSSLRWWGGLNKWWYVLVLISHYWGGLILTAQQESKSSTMFWNDLALSLRWKKSRQH